jgi:hypothetical protein
MLGYIEAAQEICDTISNESRRSGKIRFSD